MKLDIVSLVDYRNCLVKVMLKLHIYVVLEEMYKYQETQQIILLL